MALTITITDAGRAEIINAQHTGTSTVTIAQIGFGSAQYKPTKDQVALKQQVKRVSSVAGLAVAADTIHVMAKDEGADAYNVGEFGLFSDKGTLIAVFSQPPANGWIIQKASVSTLLLAIDIILKDISATSLTFGDITFLNPPGTVDTPGVVQLHHSLTSSSNALALTAGMGKKLQDEKQPLHETLTALAALDTTSDRLIYSTGVDKFALTPLTSFIRTLLDDKDASVARATLGAAPVESPTFATRADISGTEPFFRLIETDTDTAARSVLANGIFYMQAGKIGESSKGGSSGDILFSGYSGADLASLRVRFNGKNQDIWHAGNQGPGSGLDADTVDGKHAEAFLEKVGGTLTGTLYARKGINLTGDFTDEDGAFYYNASTRKIRCRIADTWGTVLTTARDIDEPIVSSASSGFVHKGQNGKGIVHRVDSTNYYILISDTNDARYNSFRPMFINLDTGMVNFRNGIDGDGTNIKNVNAVKLGGKDPGAYVQTTADQSIDGVKTFSKPIRSVGTYDVDGSGPNGQQDGLYVASLHSTSGTTGNPTFSAAICFQIDSTRSGALSCDGTYLWGVRHHTNAGVYKWLSRVKQADTLTNARKINGVAFDGSRDITLPREVDPADLMPPGTTFYFAGNTPPPGSLKANGARVSRTLYARLFAAIGTTYGAGDGSTTFNLPDLRGEFIRGLDDARGIDVGRTLGSSQADQNAEHIHTGTADPAGEHSHPFSYVAEQLTNRSGAATGSGFTNEPQNSSTATAGRHMHSLTINPSGGNEARPRNVAQLPCIKF